MRDQTQVREALQLIKRLQSFDIASEESVASLHGEIVDVQTQSETMLTGTELRTTTIRVADAEALKSLDLKQLSATMSPNQVKFEELVQRLGAFSPDVLSQAENYLPAGMIAMDINSVRSDTNNVGINFQFRFMKLHNGEFWPVPLENIG